MERDTKAAMAIYHLSRGLELMEALGEGTKAREFIRLAATEIGKVIPALETILEDPEPGDGE